MKKACNPREPEETPVPIIQPAEYQRNTGATFFCKQASCSLQHQSFLSVLQSAWFTRFFSAHAAHAWFCSELTGSLSSYRSSGLMASWPHQTNPASVPLQSNSFTPVKVVDGARNSKLGPTLRNDLIFANSTWIRWHVLYLSVNVIPLWNQNASMSMISLPFHSQFTAEARHRSVWTATVQVAAELLLCLQFSTQLDGKDAEGFERINIIWYNTINIIFEFWTRFLPSSTQCRVQLSASDHAACQFALAALQSNLEFTARLSQTESVGESASSPMTGKLPLVSTKVGFTSVTHRLAAVCLQSLNYCSWLHPIHGK